MSRETDIMPLHSAASETNSVIFSVHSVNSVVKVRQEHARVDPAFTNFASPSRASFVRVRASPHLRPSHGRPRVTLYE